jgi:hypothetical protein
MPYTQEFKETIKNMQKYYGKKKGEQVAFATFNKRHWRIH